LALVARRDEALQEIVDSESLDAVVIHADLADRDVTEAAVEEAVRYLGGIDVVVSNAAAAVFGHIGEVHPDDFDRTVDVTFTGAVNLVRAALPHLRRSRGTVVATGSLNARLPLPGWASYSASKHALRGFLNSLRIEEREQGTGVRVAIVHPGPIDTPLFAHATSATGHTPRVPPDAYRPEVVAQALVEAAVRPRGEVVLGGETRALDLLFLVARPAVEGLLLLIDRWYRSEGAAAASPGSLWEAPQHAQLSGGIPSRDSLFAPLQLGRRMLPQPATPVRLAGHLARGGRRAFQLSRFLTRGIPDRPPPQSSAADGAGAERHPSYAGVSSL
jgi:NAD(P)-dependent dehydrogenase (short-subunit alcohol dehydrogenase family)